MGNQFGPMDQGCDELKNALYTLPSLPTANKTTSPCLRETAATRAPGGNPGLLAPGIISQSGDVFPWCGLSQRPLTGTPSAPTANRSIRSGWLDMAVMLAPAGNPEAP